MPDRLIAELERAIVGQTANLRLVLATILSGGHVLLEDRPGVGKTVLARSLGTVLGLNMSRIQGTPDLMPTDITGVHIYQPNTSEWNFRAGPIFSPIVLVDELNRATAKAQSALLEAMSERQVTIEGRTLELPKPFIVIATQNPRGDSGTYRLGAAQVDRFATQVSFGLPNREAERAVMLGQAGSTQSALMKPVLQNGGFEDITAAVAAVDVAEPLIEYALDLIDTLRNLNDSIWLSVRVSETLLRTAKGLAFMSNRSFVTPEDLQLVTPAVVRHRIDPAVTDQQILTAIETPPVPVHGV